MYNTLTARRPHHVVIAHPNADIFVWTGDQVYRRVGTINSQIPANIVPWCGRLPVRARPERTAARSPRNWEGFDERPGGVDKGRSDLRFEWITPGGHA